MSNSRIATLFMGTLGMMFDSPNQSGTRNLNFNWKDEKQKRLQVKEMQYQSYGLKCWPQYGFVYALNEKNAKRKFNNQLKLQENG